MVAFGKEGGGGRGGLQSGDVYCWVAELAPSFKGHNINFTYSTVIRKNSNYLMLSENFNDVYAIMQ